MKVEINGYGGLNAKFDSLPKLATLIGKHGSGKSAFLHAIVSKCSKTLQYEAYLREGCSINIETDLRISPIYSIHPKSVRQCYIVCKAIVSDRLYSDGSNLSECLYGISQTYPKLFKRIELGFRRILEDLKEIHIRVKSGFLHIHFEIDGGHKIEMRNLSDKQLTFLCYLVALSLDAYDVLLFDDFGNGLEANASSYLYAYASSNTAKKNVVVATNNSYIIDNAKKDTIIFFDRRKDNDNTSNEAYLLDIERLDEIYGDCTMSDLLSRNILSNVFKKKIS